MDEAPIKIPLNKKKIVLIILGSIVFVLGGTWLIWLHESIIYSFIGVIANLFFGAAGIYAFIKLFDRTMGVIIDSNGIYDNSSAASIGLIRWSDIKKIGTYKIQATEFLLIYVYNPNEYIVNIENKKKALILTATHKMYGTPFTISSISLKINFQDLENIIKEHFFEYKNASQPQGKKSTIY